ncbi:hypothetical protein CTAYLR_010604 [Chrysophaeum taylorii]|uniref:ABC1 atypical kinase-like domain-containing protein n=1 Tax=Chrysophaeum taylorii TaxID=2483200 RepID=A0AAD7UJE8_9STRA|nr:hypothetical protein CTAYLR_010604 [Chrysophaeum taylorii]
MYRVAPPAVAAGAACASYAGYWWANEVLGEAAVERTVSFYRVALPAFVEYKTHELLGSEDFDPLHNKWAPRFRAKYLELGGFYLKQGQGIANNVADLFPKRWQEEMEPILDRVPAYPAERVREILEEEGVEVEVKELLGSASIGQVHRARWNGRDVVVKVQYPEVERTFRGDVFAVKRICRDLFPQYYVAFEEIERQFKTEFDYRGEAANSEQIRESLGRRFPDVIVPKVHLATKRVLIMDEVKGGVALTKALKDLAEREAKRRGITAEELAEAERRKDEEAAAQGRLIRLWGMSASARLVDKLLAIHGYEVLINGCFNGDPHPGNVLLAGSKIALIDYGQVKRLDDATRLNFAKLILLVDLAIQTDPRSGEGDPAVFAAAKRAVADAMLETGFSTKNNDPECLYELASVYLGRDDRAWIWPRNFQQWTDHMERLDPVSTLSEPLVMVVRCGMLLRGIGHVLRQHRNLAHAWKPIATTALRDANQLETTLDQIEAIKKNKNQNHDH